MATTTQVLEEAIERSSTHNEIVHLQVADLGDTREAVLALIADLAGDLEHDYTVSGDMTEVWAWEAGAPDGVMAWRLHLHG